MSLTLKERVEKLEAQVEKLERELAETKKPQEKDWHKNIGIFANDPMYDEVVRLGREYRERDRRRAKRRGLRRNTSNAGN